MIKYIRIAVLSFCASFVYSNVWAVQTFSPAQNISISDGLAHNGVTSVFQDSRGIFWFGTYDGLNRYDGYECRTYKNSKFKKLFVSNRIRTISEDKQGNLWLGTDNGITVYNHLREKFTNIYSNQEFNTGISGPIVRKIIMCPENELVICATEGDGILVFNSDFSFSEKIVPKQMVQHLPLFYDGIQLDSSNFVFSSSVGLFSFSLKTKRLNRIFHEDVFDGKSIRKINGNTFLVTRTTGFCYYSYTFEDAQYKFSRGKLFFDNYRFFAAAVDKNDDLWLGTDSRGVIKITSNSQIMNNLEYTVSYFNTESGFLRVSCFWPTKNFGCWLGTFNKGVYKFDIDKNPIHFFNTRLKQKYAIQTNEILNITQADEQRIFVSANRGGTGLFNTRLEKFEPLPFAKSADASMITGPVYVDSRKNTWLRYNQKICRIMANEHTQPPLEIKCDSIPGFSNSQPRYIVEDKRGNIWLGCVNNVFKISVSKSGKIEKIESLNKHPFFVHNPISALRKIYIDPHYNFIWIGTEFGGLLRINNTANTPLDKLDVKQFLHNKNNPKSISSNFVSDIIRLPNGEMWIGTEQGGINHVRNSDTSPDFISFVEQDGLSNDVVKSILYDDRYNLWISTNIGLNKFDTRSLKFRSFRKNNGLPFEDFTYSKARLQNGYLVFSGLDGFIYFKPEEIPNYEIIPKLEFDEISIFNQTVLPGDTIGNRVLYTKKLENGDELKLNYNENEFSIALSSLHYSSPENHFIKYRLLPFNSNWVEVTSSQRLIRYNGLPPDKYELEVMASNSLKEWGEPQKIYISIAPPFWATLPAYILYVLLVGSVFYAIVYYVLRMNRLKHNLQIEQIEKDNVKQINAAKLRFFSNISHEIKTPLTLLSGPVNMLSERFRENSDVREKLKIIQRQTKNITQLVEQVHDFQKSDANQLKVEYSVFGFKQFINDVLADFQFMAQTEQKILRINNPENEIYISADKDKLGKIVNNLLNNAFKYSRANDTITVDYRADESDLVFSVSDTGKGIRQEDLPHIFERFYQSRDKNDKYIAGAGIGLAFTKRLVEMHYGFIEAKSELNKGTEFLVRLPVITTKVSEIQKVKEKEILLMEEKNEVVQDLQNIDPTNIKHALGLSESVVFIVEDNTELRRFIEEVLSAFFKVKSFVNGLECLNELEKEWPDIIISDVKMPELNGFDLCKKVKTDIKTSHIPVILLTACTKTDDELHGLQAGADSYIKKPFEVQHLVTQIETLLVGRKKLFERFQTDFPLTLSSKDENSKDTAFLNKLYDLMAENLDNQDLDINSFAKKLYLNRTQFYKKVKIITNYTPYELLKSYRLNKAAEFLEKQYQVNDVFVMTGFKNRTHFSKLFKEKFNTSPAKYAAQSAKTSQKTK